MTPGDTLYIGFWIFLSVLGVTVVMGCAAALLRRLHDISLLLYAILRQLRGDPVNWDRTEEPKP